MVSKLQNNLWEHTIEFFQDGKKKKKSKGNDLDDEVLTPNPRAELPYTYLKAWFMMHCPNLMTSRMEDSNESSFIQIQERCDWSNHYMRVIRNNA